MARCVEVLATKPDDLSLIPGAHEVEEQISSFKESSDSDICIVVHALLQTQINNVQRPKNKF